MGSKLLVAQLPFKKNRAVRLLCSVLFFPSTFPLHSSLDRSDSFHCLAFDSQSSRHTCFLMSSRSHFPLLQQHPHQMLQKPHCWAEHGSERAQQSEWRRKIIPPPSSWFALCCLATVLFALIQQIAAIGDLGEMNALVKKALGTCVFECNLRKSPTPSVSFSNSFSLPRSSTCLVDKNNNGPRCRPSNFSVVSCCYLFGTAHSTCWTPF